MYNEPIKCTRQELFEQVWSQSMVKLAKVYGLSDVGLRKICKRYNIPLPPQGYWARKRKPLIRPLLLPHKNNVIEIHILKKEFSSGLQQEYDKALEQVALEKGEGQIAVSKQLRKPHHLVAKTELAFKDARVSEFGILIPQMDNYLNLSVGKKSLRRSLIILDALLKALDVRGYEVAIKIEGDGYKKRNRTFIYVGESTIEFNLQEFLSRTENKGRDYPRYSFKPNGRLSLTIDEWADGVRKSWTDGKKQRLEDCLSSFIISVIRIAAIHRARKLERERQEREWQELQRIQEEEARLRKEEAARVKALEDAAENWFKSKQIRSYIEAVKETALTRNELTPDLEQWLIWANEQANRLDPLLYDTGFR